MTEGELDFDPEELAMLRQLFRSEAQDALEGVTALVLAAGSAPPSREALIEMMRATHTMKGAAGTVGLPAMVDLAHRLENAFAAFSRDSTLWTTGTADVMVEVMDAMRGYLDAMEKAVYTGPKPAEETPIVIAALRPKMLALAAERTAGAHPYNVTPEHTARARKILGSGPTLAPEQMVLLETSPSKAREVARKNLAIYLTLPNYANNWRWLGFGDADFASGGSDRLIDAIVAWGDEKAIAARVKAHFDAGADHVCIQVVDAVNDTPPRESWRRLAAAVLAV